MMQNEQQYTFQNTFSDRFHILFTQNALPLFSQPKQQQQKKFLKIYLKIYLKFMKFHEIVGNCWNL